MNKIKFAANKDTNYVFHMLSVARCGYDNAYGEKYRRHYAEEDLMVISQNRELLTVCGGEHCGELVWLMVSEAACAKVSAKEYYAGLLEKADRDELPEPYRKYTDIVRSISAVMIKHYDHYAENIWPKEKKKIEGYIPQILRLFEESCFTDRAEEYVGCKLGNDFTATLVTSVENGAEAIDISKEQDVFGIERTPMDSFYFIGHEFIIYLLMNALKDENALRNFNTWGLTEGLAEYYLKKIMGDVRFFDSQQKYVELYEKWDTGWLSAAELYRMGLEREGISLM